MKDNDFMNAILTAAVLSGAQKKEQAQPKGNENMREATAKLAKPLYEGYLGFQDAGFTSEQAFQLTLAMAKR